MTQQSTILIVDDEPFNVDYLEQELEYLGYDTESATNGREALEKVAASAPDLILLDVMMPGIDGFTVCRMLKDDRKTRFIPIIIMTALNSTEDRVKGIEAGADDFLTKPVNEQELIARIKTALRFKHAIDAEMGELRKVSDHLAKFVPDTVTRLIAANPSNPELEKREQDVSILFLDVTGYSRLSETIAPEVLNMLIERYFSAFLDQIQDSGGEVSGSAGDGLMAIFEDGDPNKHAITAADTALALFATNDRLNAENSIQPLGIHIGINSGRALVGPTRYHGQRGVRWVFTADGPVINLAARLADVATDGPFSIFSGIDRSIAVIEGDGMDLHYPDGRKTGLDLNKVVNFDGGDAIEGKLRNGAIKDFNVMADRRYFKAILEIASGPIEIEKSTLAGSILLIHILEGSSILSEANQEDRIVETGETVIGEGIIDVTLTLKSAARAAIVTLEATEHKSK